jgi:L-glyceraldehyde 3-phosphate reductase
MLNRWVERDGLKDTLKELGIGSIAFTPLAQGMLTNKYLKGIPEDSRAAQGKSLKKEFLNEQAIAHINKLNEIARSAGAKRWRRWRWHGCCAMAASRRR